MSGKYCSPLSSLPVAAQRAIEEAALAYNRGFESYKWRNLDEVFDEYCTKNPLATTAEKEALLVELLQVELKKPIPFGKPNGLLLTLNELKDSYPTLQTQIEKAYEKLPNEMRLLNVIGRYRVLEHIGCGGQANVVRARTDDPASEDVAIKYAVRPAQQASLLHNEGWILEKLKACEHPNIIEFHGRETRQNFQIQYVVFPLLPGKPLAAISNLGVNEVLEIAVQISSAIACVHSKHCLHCDISTGNIRITTGIETQKPTAILLDFGYATRTTNSNSLRPEGYTLGKTDHFMAPEQSTGDQIVSEQTDIFQLGAVLGWCVTGGVYAKDYENFRKSVRQSHTFPKALRAAVLKATERNPDERFRTASEMHLQFVRCRHQNHPRKQVFRSALALILVSLFSLQYIYFGNLSFKSSKKEVSPKTSSKGNSSKLATDVPIPKEEPIEREISESIESENSDVRASLAEPIKKSNVEALEKNPQVPLESWKSDSNYPSIIFDPDRRDQAFLEFFSRSATGPSRLKPDQNEAETVDKTIEGENVRTLLPNHSYSFAAPVTGVEIFPNGKNLLVYTKRNEIFCINISTGDRVFEIPNPDDKVGKLLVSPNSQRILCHITEHNEYGRPEWHYDLLDAASGEPIRNSVPLKTSAQFTPQSDLIYYANRTDGSFTERPLDRFPNELFDGMTGEALSGPNDSGLFLGSCGDREYLSFEENSQTVFLREATLGDDPVKASYELGMKLTEGKVADQGNRVLLYSKDELKVVVLDIPSLKPIYTAYSEQGYQVRCPNISWDGKRALVDPGTIRGGYLLVYLEHNTTFRSLSKDKFFLAFPILRGRDFGGTDVHTIYLNRDSFDDEGNLSSDSRWRKLSDLQKKAEQLYAPMGGSYYVTQQEASYLQFRGIRPHVQFFHFPSRNVYKLEFPERADCSYWRIAPNGRTIAAVCEDGAAKVWVLPDDGSDTAKLEK